MADPRPEARRGFLRGALGALGAAFAALFGVPGAGALVSPALREREDAWVDAGDAAAVKAGAPVRVAFDVASGWETVKETAFLVREGDAIVALSSKCTHFGCRVRWRGGAGAGEFHCPCHDGRFTAAGEPAGGPPTEPLARLDVRVENGRVKVRTGRA